MKKTIAIMITGALVASTAVTAFAAQNSDTKSVPMEENTELAATGMNQDRPELPEGVNFTDGERPELPEGVNFTDGERPELPEGVNFTDGERPELPDNTAAGKYIPKLKPETKPEGEDMVPPEFEGIENIEVLGRPDLLEGAPDMQRPDMQFGGMAPEGMNGESRPDMQFGGEGAPDQQFGGMAPEGMNGESRPDMQFGGEAAPDQQFGGMAPEGMDGESAPGQPFGNEAPVDFSQMF